MEIWNKKIILLGNIKIKNDLTFLYEELDFEQRNLNEDFYFLEENKDRYFIVICEIETKKDVDEFLLKYKLEYDKHYTYCKDFFMYYNPIFLKRKNRKLAVWGTGAAASELWEVLNQREISSEIDFYIDNAKGIKSIFMGKPVMSPIEIEGSDNIFIVVATRLYQKEIYQQLKGYGFQSGKDYVHYTDVCMDYTAMLERVCFSEKKYKHSCPRPFGYCDIIGENLYFCCPDYLPISAGSMNLNDFWDCWNSYVARILRLSVTNGTFCFCNQTYCDIFDFERESNNEKSNHEENLIAEIKEKYTRNLEMLMIGIDFSCNLKCPSCRENICVANIEERKKIDQWAEDLLENVIPYAKRLWLAGNGEVFFSGSYKKILNDERCKKRKSINILSNGMLFDEEAWKLLEEYQTIEVAISMDGVRDETIELLRRGSNADRLKENLKMLGELRKKGKIKELSLSCVLQAMNVAELYDLLEYSKEIGIDRVSFLKMKDNGEYARNDKLFDQVSLFDKNDCLKEEYKRYFTYELLQHPLADWTNSAKSLGVEMKDADPFRW